MASEMHLGKESQNASMLHGQIDDKSHADCVEGCALYLNMSLSGWLRSMPRKEVASFILDWCQKSGIPGLNLIVSTDSGFHIKWLFVEPLAQRHLARWNAVQKFLHEKFECLGSDPNFGDREAPCEVSILYRAEAKGTFDDFARRLPLTKDTGKAYQDARRMERRAEPKRQRQKTAEEDPGMAILSRKEEDMTSILSFFHQPDDSEWMCVKQMHPLEKGRRALYDWLHPLDRMSFKTGSSGRDLYFSAGEFAIKKRSEKWVSSIRCNFLSLVWNRSELDYMPALEETVGLIHARCDERDIPRPTLIMHTGEGAFLAWAYGEPVTKLGSSDSFHFNDEWSDVEKFLFSQFWDLGADPRQLHAAAMVRMPGSLNTTAKDSMVRVLDAPGVLYSFSELRDRARGRTAWQKTQSIPHGWEHDLLAFHKESRNLVCLGYFEADAGERKWRQKWVLAHCLLDELSRWNLDQDLYVTQLEFSVRKRDVKNVASMRVNFLDIDWKRLEGNSLTPEAWKDHILEHCRELHIPEPNVVVFSGNGLHVKWIYTAPIAKGELARWNLVQRLLLSQFGELGADTASIDAARVLRVPGSRNGKPETEDRRVRLLHHSTPKYAFDEFMDKVKTSIPVDPKGFNACLTEFEDAPAAIPQQGTEQNEVCFVMNSEENLKHAEGNWLLHELNFHHPRDAWMYLEDSTGEQKLWIPVRELHNTLRHLDLSQEWRMSPAEFSRTTRAEDESHIAAIPFNFVNITRCPEGYRLNSQACVDAFKERCRHVCDVGIFEPTRFIDTGHSLLAVWGYDHPLPGIALSRWKAVQEFVTHHFRDWGTESDLAYLSADTMLPLTGFLDGSSQRIIQVVYHQPATYSFDDLAKNILPWSQEEVRKYEDKKRASKNSGEAQKGDTKAALGFAKKALARYKDIVHLLRMRRTASNNVPEGYRELCVFWAMNCGVQSGLINADNFNGYVQKLTELCGANFNDCGPETLTSLKKRLLSGQETYTAKTQTLIKELGITMEEQRQMKVLNTLRRGRRYRTPRSRWLALHHQENNRPWEKLHISRSTYFARRRRQREAITKKRAARHLNQTQLRSFLITENAVIDGPDLLARTGMPLYYERDVKKRGCPALE